MNKTQIILAITIGTAAVFTIGVNWGIAIEESSFNSCKANFDKVFADFKSVEGYFWECNGREKALLEMMKEKK